MGSQSGDGRPGWEADWPDIPPPPPNGTFHADPDGDCVAVTAGLTC